MFEFLKGLFKKTEKKEPVFGTYKKVLGTADGGTGLSSAGSSGNVLTSDGTNWTSSTASSINKWTISGKSSGFTASDGAGYYYRTTGSMTCTLPASPADGSVRKFKSLSGTLTFSFNGSDTINHADGTSDQSLSLETWSGVIELIAVSGGWDET